MVIGATAAVGLQAAVAAASAAFFVEHGVVFYSTPGATGQRRRRAASAIWIAVALVCRGQAASRPCSASGGSPQPAPWPAPPSRSSSPACWFTPCSAAPSACSARPSPPSHARCDRLRPRHAVPARGLPGGAFSFRYQNFVSTPAFRAIGVIAAIAAVAAARHRPPTPRSNAPASRRRWSGSPVSPSYSPPSATEAARAAPGPTSATASRLKAGS